MSAMMLALPGNTSPKPMNLRHLSLAILATSTLLLAACSKEEAAAPAVVTVAPAQAYDAVAAGAKGFTVGALMGANPVYVLFDPQCPHCSQLWKASQPLNSKVKFIWVPVAIIGPKSLPQGAALMQASDPVQAMNEHELSLLAGQGGLSASANVPADVEAAIKANSQLLDSLGADAVPFIVAKNARNGQVVNKAGAMATPALAELLGVSAP